MNQTKFVLLIAIVFTIGVWGCARQAHTPGLARLRDLEDRNAKLEKDYQALLKQRDQERRNAASLGEKCEKLTAELALLRTAADERDELRRQIAGLTSERNTVQATLTQFTKELNQLLGRMESTTATAPPAAPVRIIPAATSLTPSDGPVLDLPNKS
jgi:chromosome segregation ATPase